MAASGLLAHAAWVRAVLLRRGSVARCCLKATPSGLRPSPLVPDQHRAPTQRVRSPWHSLLHNVEYVVVRYAVRSRATTVRFLGTALHLE